MTHMIFGKLFCLHSGVFTYFLANSDVEMYQNRSRMVDIHIMQMKILQVISSTVKCHDVSGSISAELRTGCKLTHIELLQTPTAGLLSSHNCSITQEPPNFCVKVPPHQGEWPHYIFFVFQPPLPALDALSRSRLLDDLSERIPYPLDDLSRCAACLPPGDARPSLMYIARGPEPPRAEGDTPPKKCVIRGDTFLDAVRTSTVHGMQVWPRRSPISTHFFDVGLGLHEPVPFGHDGLPRDHLDDYITWEEAQADPTADHPHSPPSGQPVPLPADPLAIPPVPSSPVRRNRFLDPPPAPLPANAGPPQPPSAPLRAQPRRGAAPRAFVHDRQQDESDGSAGEDTFVPSPAQAHRDLPSDEDPGSSTEEEEDDQPARTKTSRKGKAAASNASAGPSGTGGRPTGHMNEEVEHVGKRIQGELVALAEKVGVTYETLLRKMGLSRTEVREPTLGNVFRAVHKQRLIASGQGMFDSLYSTSLSLTQFQASSPRRSTTLRSKSGRNSMWMTRTPSRPSSLSTPACSPVPRASPRPRTFLAGSRRSHSRWLTWSVIIFRVIYTLFTPYLGQRLFYVSQYLSCRRSYQSWLCARLSDVCPKYWTADRLDTGFRGR